MLHFTAFGGTAGEISPAGFTAVTLFGGAELRRPTLAQRLMHVRQRRRQPEPTGWRRWLRPERNMIFTAFGGTVIQRPTMLEEYQALRSLVRNAGIDVAELSDLIEELTTGGDHELFSSITLFGATATESPSVKKEKTALDTAQRAGLLDGRERAALEAAIGAPDAATARLLGNLVAAPG